VEHWRDPFVGNNFGQMFLNYVRAEGTRRSHMYDGRRDAFPPTLCHSRFVSTEVGSA
jgi:hypothetical protein